MNLRCLCGHSLSDTGAPNDVEHLLLSYRAMEALQDLVDAECAADGEIQMWPEHWENAGAMDIWKCFECGRLYFDPKGKVEDIIVYRIERKGLDIK